MTTKLEKLNEEINQLLRQQRYFSEEKIVYGGIIKFTYKEDFEREILDKAAQEVYAQYTKRIRAKIAEMQEVLDLESPKDAPVRMVSSEDMVGNIQSIALACADLGSPDELVKAVNYSELVKE